METQINLWDSLKSKKSSTITIDKWLDLIKSENEYSSIIREARLIGKPSPTYDYLKEKLPCATLAFSFKDSRTNSSIIDSTGFIYVDFDCNSKEQALKAKQEFISNEHTYAVWLSLSEMGIGALIKVENIDKDNYARQYKQILESLNINFDKQAVKTTQPNILSSDEFLYLNKESKVLDFGIFSNKKEKRNIIIKDTEKTIFSTENNDHLDKKIFKLRFTLDNYKTDCDYYKDGLPYFEAYWPYSNLKQRSVITSGKRNHTISTFAHNLIILNKDSTVEEITSWIYSFNKSYCQPPLSYGEVKAIVDTKYTLKDSLQPIGIKNKKYWTNPNATDKKKAFQDARRNRTTMLIEQFLSDELFNFDKKVTYKIISEVTGLSLITIKRNLTDEHKKYINEFNKSLE
jgi:hypothetical protein